MTGVKTRSVASAPVVLLVAVSVGAWLLVPILMRRGQPMGRYLAWTFRFVGTHGVGASPGRPLVLAPGETTYGVATYIVVGDASPSAFRFSAAVRDGVPWNRRCPLRYLCCTSDHYT